jgi:hypothetical protein
MIFVRKSRLFLLVGALLCYLSYFAFFFLLFDKAPTHHYYTVPFQVGVLLHLYWLGDLASKLRLPRWAAGLAIAAGLLLLNVNAIHAGKNANARFSHDRDFSIFNDLEPQLTALNIRYEDRVLSYDDFSFNISLYLMNRKGVTLSPHSNEAAAEAALASCNFAVLTDTLLLQLPAFQQRIGPPIGRHKTLTIHAILPPPR